MSGALAAARPAEGVLAQLFARQRQLAAFGLALIALTAVLGLAQLVDARTLGGVNVWLKPAKFAFSIGVFALTAAWFFGYVRPERRGGVLMRGVVATIIATGAFELGWITLQASRGLASHYNTDTAFYTAMYNLMGVLAVLLVATTLPLAWEIGRRPAAGLRSDFVLAVVLGLLLTFLLGGGLGGYMGGQASHAVGPEGGGVPVFGWNRLGGDLRIAHFMGIHAEQAITALGALAGGLSLSRGRLLVVAGAAAWSIATLLLFAQAVSGRALLPM